MKLGAASYDPERQNMQWEIEVSPKQNKKSANQNMLICSLNPHCHLDVLTRLHDDAPMHEKLPLRSF